jgi:hypothetical protein
MHQPEGDTGMRELGELIRSAREAKGITLEQAAAETRIRRAYLDAMEDGDLRIFPGTAYATGFLRNYATYLGLNADEVIQTFHAMSPTASGITIAPATTVGVERMRRRSRRKIMWTTITVCLVLVCGYAVKSYSAGPNTSSPPPNTPHPTSTSSSHNGDRAGDADHPPVHAVHPKTVIRVHAAHTAWVRVVTHGHVLYWGPVKKGTTMKWKSHYLRLVTHHGPSLRVWVDGTHTWRISHSQGKFVLLAGPITWHHRH